MAGKTALRSGFSSLGDLKSDRLLGARLGQLGLPTIFILEGGYAAAELGVNAVNVLEGFEKSKGLTE